MYRETLPFGQTFESCWMSVIDIIDSRYNGTYLRTTELYTPSPVVLLDSLFPEDVEPLTTEKVLSPKI